MGVGFSHCDASWAYSGFNDFRERLAALVGIDLWSMRGFSHSRRKGDGTDGKEWPSAESEPLVHLLNHSDCDGHLTPGQMEVLVPRLSELLLQIDGYDREQGEALLCGMVAAMSLGENLEFH